MTRSRPYRQLPHAVSTSSSPHGRLAAAPVTLSVAVTATGAFTFQVIGPYPGPWIRVIIVVILIIVVLDLGRRLFPRRALTSSKERYSMRVTRRFSTRGPVH